MRQFVHPMALMTSARPADDVAEILVTAEQIAAKVAELGRRIAADYESKDLVLVSILKGALPFLADLMRATQIPLALDFLEVSSYGAETETSGVVRILKDLAQPIEGRDVLVVEDILDTGHTLAYVLEHLRGQRPASLHLCVLLDKPARRIIPVEIDYRGFEIPDKFVVGYGLDYAERYRNLPFVGVLKPEVYARRP
jgi:hypoxanthine phosphoribosyltransferase